MPSQKRSREKRRANPDQLAAIAAARRERDTALREAGAEFGSQITKIKEDWRAERQEIWGSFPLACEARDASLAKARAKHNPKVARLELAWNAARREIWARFTERTALIRRSTMLAPAG